MTSIDDYENEYEDRMNNLYRSLWDGSLVTAEQVAGAKELVFQWKHGGTKVQPSLAEYGIALAVDFPVQVKPESEDKVSNPRTKNSTVYARELVLKDGVTVGDLFALIDVPYRISRKAKVSLVEARTQAPFTLRVEWTGAE